ncbi:MAG: nucleotidyltransferase domain-containing protein [Desulfobacterales bacterium]|nr:nucleotidyltransferase domain-containing protein [Desulfobacterales bacterium]
MEFFGSRARGDSVQKSDFDLLAIVDEKTPAIETNLDDIAYQIM